MVDVARLRGRVEIAGAQQAQAELRGVGRAFDDVARQSGQSAGGFRAFNDRVLEVQGRARTAQSGINDLGTSVSRAATQARDAEGRFTSMDDALDAVSGSSKRAGAGLQDLARGALAGAGAFAAYRGLDLLMDGVGAAVDFAADNIIGLNDRLQQAEIGFTTMLGSAEAATGFLSDLADFAAATPFEFPELVTASQRMLAMGFAADDILPLLTSVGDSVAALGTGSQGIDRVTTALGQMQAKTKVSAEEMLQLTEAGIPAWQLLADHIGVSVAEVQKMGSEGKIAADTFIAAFQSFSSVNFGGMMDEQSRTFSGAMSNIQDALSMAVAEGGEPFFEMLQDGTVQLAEFTSSDRFAAWAETAAEKAEDATESLRGFWADNKDGLADIALTIGDTAGAAADLAVSLGDAAVAINEYLTNAQSGEDESFIANQIRETDEDLQELASHMSFASKILHNEWPNKEEWQILLGLPWWLPATEGAADFGHALEVVSGHANAAVEGAASTVERALLLIGRAFSDGTGPAEEYSTQLDMLRQSAIGIEPAARVLFTALEDVNRAGHRGTQTAADLGVSIGELAAAYQPLSSQLDSLAGAYQVAGDMAGVFNKQGGEFRGIASDLESAYDVLNQRKEEGLELSDEELRFLDGYQENLARVEGGMDDAAIQAGLYRQAQVNLMTAQDELNRAINDGADDLGPYRQAVADAETSLGDAAAASGGMRDANSLLTDVLLTQLTPAIRDLRDILIELGGLDPEITITADTTPAYAAVQGFKDFLANNPASIDLYVNQNNAIGFTTRASGGPLDAGQMALVGEEGPELIVTNAPAHVIPNDETMRLLALANGFAGGFADGTAHAAPRGSQGAIGMDVGGFADLGAAIAEAIALGVKLGLLESGTPTGSEYAQALIDGATEQIDTDGDKVLDAWVVVHERIPELAANLGQDTVMGLLEQYADLQGQLQLAILSGDDTGEIQAQLDAIFALFAAWSGNTVENVEAVWDAITDEQRAAAAQAMWEDVLGSIQTPSAPVSVSLDDIISGDAIADVREAFFELYDLQKMYEEAGLPEQAAAIGEQMKALGLQEELVVALAGTDTAEKLAEALRLEELGAALDERMDAVLGDNPLGIADSIQDELDDLQTKIDLGPVMGVPQEIIAGWAAERDALTGEQDQFWSDLATAFSAGALDPEVLAELDEAGRAQLGNYIMGLFGQGAYEDFVAAMEDADYAQALEDGLVKATDESLAQLGALFAEAPEMALDMVDELLDAVGQGQMSFEDAMALLAGVPEKDLIPALEGLEETLTADLAQALLSYGPDSPQVQAILASLGLIDGALDDVTGSAEDATTALDNLPGSKNYVAPGDQTPDAAPGTANTGTVGLSAVGPIAADFSDLVAGTKYTIPGDSGWAEALAAGAVISIDADKLMYPQSGYEMWKSGANVYVNPFADGGIVTEPTLALIGEAGTEGVFPLERAGEFGFGGLTEDDARMIARALADELRRAPMQNHFSVDGRDVAVQTLKHLASGVPAGIRSAP